MKLSISNIAWEQHDDREILKLLKSHQVDGIEVAPSKIWPAWEGISYKSARDYKDFLTDYGFEIPAMQALLFGKNELQVFDPMTHKAFFEHIRLLTEVAVGLESQVLVFGSPKNRRRFQLNTEEARKKAVDFFYQVGEICKTSGCVMGIEHNPIEYGCDFLTNIADVVTFVQHLEHENVKVHIDSAGIHMCGGDELGILQKIDDFAHFHLSAPMLEALHTDAPYLADYLTILENKLYTGWISIEMKQQDDTYSTIDRTLKYINSLRGDVLCQ